MPITAVDFHPLALFSIRRDAAVRLSVVSLVTAALWCTAFLPGGAQAAIYRVGSGAGCDYSNLAIAVTFAGLTEEDDEIWVTEDLSGISVVLEDFDPTGAKGALTIDGGYSSCGATRGVGGSPRNRLTGSASGPVLTVRTTGGNRSVVELRNLELRDAPDHRGLLIDGGEVELTNVVIENNEGGVEVRDGELNVDRDVRIQENQTPGIGGGIYCFGAEVALKGRLENNEALGGGGIYAVAGCQVELLGAKVHGNQANLGAGAYVSGAATRLVSTNGFPSALTVFSENDATAAGGGIYADEAATVEMNATWFTGNTSEEHGSAIVVDGASLWVEPAPGLPCSPRSGDGCNRFTANRTEGNPGSASVIREQDAYANLKQVVFSDNETIEEGFGTLISSARSTFLLDNAVLANNRVSYLLFQIDGSVSARFISAAGNRATDTAENGARIGFIASAAETALFHLQSSVLPGHFGLIVTNSSPTADCVIAKSLFGFSDVRSLETDVETGMFVDAPAGDLRLLPNALAVDYCDVGAARGALVDIEGTPRPSDVASAPDLHGPFDLGAFESLILFADGFESGNTSAWSSGG